MKAIIPVAGVGSRLRPHTFTLPKVLLTVAGKPIIGHIIDKIIEEGIKEAVIVVGYLGDMIEEYLTEHYKEVKFTFVEQEERLGLGHSIWIAREHIGTEPVLIILGDTVFEVNFKGVLTKPYSSLGVKVVDDPRRFGVAEVSGEFITKLVEKPEHPKTNLAIVGLYFIKNPKLLIECLDNEVRNDIRTKGEYQLTDALQMMIDKGEKFTTFGVDGWYDCGKPETLLSTNQKLLLTKSHYRPVQGCVINSPVFIADGAKIENSVIGPYATIGERAVIKDSIVKNSIIGEDATVDGMLLESAIVGSNASIYGKFRKINLGDSSEVDFR
jgi:glucose-1-phosphate thymidylyltransferase